MSMTLIIAFNIVINIKKARKQLFHHVPPTLWGVRGAELGLKQVKDYFHVYTHTKYTFALVSDPIFTTHKLGQGESPDIGHDESCYTGPMGDTMMGIG